MYKRIMALILATAMITMLGMWNVNAEPENQNFQAGGIVITAETENGYVDYLEANKDFANATMPVIMDTTSGFSHSGSGVAVLPEGVALTQVGDSISWTIDVAENAFYIPFIYYTAIDGNGSNIELSLSIDGEIPYTQAENFLLYRQWKNSTDTFDKSKKSNDEFSPEQIEVFEKQVSGIFDSEGFVTDELKIALSKGVHTVSLSLKAESVRIEKLVFEIPQELPSYNEYAFGFKNSPSYSGKEIVIEGEKAKAKSQKSFVPMSARNDADVSPADPFSKRMNYIGGTNWNSLGGAITWEIEAPTDGWYKLGFHFRQNYLQEGTSYRRLSIDGKTPFKEAEAIPFNYSSGWQYFTLEDNKGKEMPVYLTKGNHTLTLTVTLGELADYAAQLKEITDTLGVLYRKIVKITGETPDNNRDYDLFVAIPELGEELPKLSKKLESLAKYSEKISGSKGGSNAQIVRKAAVTIDQMLEVKYKAHTKLSAFYDNYSSLCSWAYEMQNMALDIDTVLLTKPGCEFKHGNVGFWDEVEFFFKRLFSSFEDDYTAAQRNEESLVLWLNWGRDQITLLENLISNDFTPKYGIDVDIKITATTLVQAGLAGNGPDMQLSVARTDPLNYAMRGLLYDLKKFDNYNEIIKRFSKTATVPYEYQNGVYGLPSTETFNMMFIRTDIFEELNLEIPKTWDEFIKVSKVLTLNNMNCGMTTDGFMFMAQMGVSPYKEDKSATNLMSAEAVEAYTFMTDFYTKYKFPKTYSFFNRFRTGLMPMAIASYAENATLRAAAPEINGKWRMVELPGFLNEDGTVSNYVNGTGTANVILEWSEKKDKAWKFLDWWTSDDIQYRFSTNIESILGASGRYESANLNAVYKLGWDNVTLNALQNQFSKVKNFPEVPGSYYVSRSVQQVYWNVVNNGQNVEDMLEKWIPEADDEIRRKTEEYVKK
ncbi:MAG: extracellular solute-binding protein [Ruminococcaceae bacterium]|nr:extracellular solute-binding protein [Oscillospiraceae bacterium]